MATASQMTSLIRAFKENDHDSFLSTAIQLAAHEAKLGHGAVANEIRQLIDGIKKQQTQSKVISFNSNDFIEVADLGLVLHPENKLQN